MSNELLFQLGFFALIIGLGSLAILRETDLIKTEHRIWVYIKAFFKALYYTAKERGNKNV